MIAIYPKAGAGIQTNELLELLEKIGVPSLRLVGDAHLTRLYLGMIVVERSSNEKEILKILKVLPIISSAKNLKLKEFWKLPIKMQYSREEWLSMDRH